MKNRFSGLLIATAVIAGSVVTPVALNKVQAASVQQKQTVLNEKFVVNGQPSNVQYKVLSNARLYSSANLAKIMSAGTVHKKNSFTYTFTKTIGKTKHSLTVTVRSTTAVVNGKKVKLAKAPRLVGGTLYVDAAPFIDSLGGSALADSNLIVSTNGSITYGQAQFNVDGQIKSIRTITIGGKQYFSATDLSKLASASIKTDKSNQYEISKNGKTVKIGSNPFKVKGIVYDDLNDIVKALGGDIVNQSTGKFISTAGLVSGDAYNPQWINDSTLLFNDSVDSNSYVVNVNSKKTLLKINGIEIVASPDGKEAVYADDNGAVHLVNLSTGKDATLNSTDTNSKFDFVWSNDGTKVYFIAGSSMTDVDCINLSDGSITTLYTDSNTSKADLALSADGKKLIYTVGKTGTTVYTDSNDTNVSGIDLSNTETQLYSLDLTAAQIAPVQLTTSNDNKVFSAFLPNGNIVYTSYDSSGTALPVLNMIDTSNVISPLVSNMDIATTDVTAQGNIIIVVNEKNGYQAIDEVDPTTKQITQLAQTKLEITSISFSADGKQMAITVPGKAGDVVMVLNNGQFDELSK